MELNNTSSQLAHSPSEALVNNDTDNIEMNEIYSTELIMTSQSSVSLLNTTNMIPSQRPIIRSFGQPNTTTTQGQEGRRRRRQRQRQRRRQRREEQRREQERFRQALRRQAQRQRQQQRREDQERAQEQREHRPVETQQQQQNPLRSQWSTLWYRSRRRWPPSYEREYSDDTEDDPFTEALLEAYDWDKLDPKERWEQEQMNEFEGFAALEQLLLMQDQLEQQNQIDAVVQIQREEQDDTNQVQLVQTELWEQAAFIVQQQNEY